MQKINAIRGMNDILPDKSYAWVWLEDVFNTWLKQYGYNNIRTPIVEDTRLFIRSIGEVTDIVEKEMYSFIDKLNNDSLTLRPEGTAGTLRAAIEHNLLYNRTQKLWYIGPMFRHERPQKGRYRQFYQLGVEALGFKGPDIDAEIILMQSDLWKRLGIESLELQINCLGNKVERAKHREALIKYLEQYVDLLDEDAKRRLYSNPLRILDSKNKELNQIIDKAPKLIDYLDEGSLSHYNEFKRLLTNLEIKFVENNRLVRGLDYYNLSVFEWVSNDLGTQSTVCAGGRYDPLIEELGGNENYAIGFAIGIERLLLIIESQNKLPQNAGIDIFIANLGFGTKEIAFKLAHNLRTMEHCSSNYYSVVQQLGDSSFKSQLKQANALGAKLSIIIGENELSTKKVMVKSMLTGEQELVDLDLINNYVTKFFNRI